VAGGGLTGVGGIWLVDIRSWGLSALGIECGQMKSYRKTGQIQLPTHNLQSLNIRIANHHDNLGDTFA
jgi:hypothetical protein